MKEKIENNFNTSGLSKKNGIIEYLEFSIICFFILTLLSCVTVPDGRNMIADDIREELQFSGLSLLLNEIDSTTDYSYKSLSSSRLGIDADIFGESVYNALLKLGFEDIIQNSSKKSDFELNARILNQTVPTYGASLTSSMLVQYTLINRSNSAVVFDEEIKSYGTAEFSERLNGNARLILSLERTAKSNISKFIDLLKDNIPLQESVQTPVSPEKIILNDDLPSITILDFSLQNFPISDALIINDLITNSLASSRRYHILDRSVREKLLSSIGYKSSSNLTYEDTYNLGQLLSVDKIVTGSISCIDNSYILTLKMLNIQAEEVSSIAYDVFSSLNDLVQGCDKVALNLEN